MIFNEFLGPENIDKEYKVAVIYWNREIKYNHSLELLRSGKWIFNECIHNTIKTYLEKYLSKYVSAFTNNLSKINNGTLYIGVDDDGYVKGIPYKGELKLNSIIPIINNIFNSLICFPSKEIMDYVRKNLKIEIIKVNFERGNLTDNEQSWYHDYLNKHNEKVLKIKKNDEYRKRWAKLLCSQTEKLYKILNRERTEFLHYIKDTKILTKSNYKHTYSHLEYLIDVPNYYDLVADLKIKEFIFEPGERLKKYKEMKNGILTDIKLHDYNSIMTLYIFGRYKDYCVDSLKRYRPTSPKIILNEEYPKNLLSQIDKMIPMWMNFNRVMNLYVIKITIPSTILKTSENITYFNPKKRKYESCFRKITKVGPITVIE
jgi:hypothetical protein